jgi:hypothetical protein
MTKNIRVEGRMFKPKHHRNGQPCSRNAFNHPAKVIRFVCSQMDERFSETNESKKPEMIEKSTKRIVSG